MTPGEPNRETPFTEGGHFSGIFLTDALDKNNPLRLEYETSTSPDKSSPSTYNPDRISLLLEHEFSPNR